MADQEIKMKLDAATDRVLALGVDDGSTEDADNRFELRANGKMEWGDGTNAQDVVLERTATSTLSLSSGYLLSPAKVVNTTGDLTLTQALHSGAVVTVNAAAGAALTLPAATGSGALFKIIIGTTITSNSTTIKVVGNDTMVGFAHVAQDGGDTSVLFGASGTDDTITLNGTTTGGTKGDVIDLIDIAADLWHVNMVTTATGTEATPFSATV